jgi:histidinol dehydrogenase
LDEELEETVRTILSDIRRGGDAALIRYTNQFDHRRVRDVRELFLPASRLQSAYASIDSAQRNALSQAAIRIRTYHERQTLASWSYEEGNGTRLGQQITPLRRVGIYVPGGKAAYPSSVLMTALPAKVAGVGEIVMVVPALSGQISELVLAAAHIAGIEEVITIGGAQAIAALAYGTDAVPRVDKIVGPGNVYVAAAKRMVFGAVGIDMIAGPSEILVVCDGSTPAEWIATDLFSQAEHDEDAQAILICPDEDYLDTVEQEMSRLLSCFERASIISDSLRARGALIKSKDLDEAMDMVNFVAPEHLELSVQNSDELLPKVHHAGAIFLGPYTSEALGDYCAGPNHVLPTAGTARFSSPLGVYDFQKRSSIIHCSQMSARELGGVASVLARGESLTAHARAAELRMMGAPSCSS